MVVSFDTVAGRYKSINVLETLNLMSDFCELRLMNLDDAIVAQFYPSCIHNNQPTVGLSHVYLL